MFEIVTEPRLIHYYNQELRRRLKAECPIVDKQRKITYPSGYHYGNVHFESGDGKSRGWAPTRNEKTKYSNLMLFGIPGAAHGLEIAVQLNFPAGKYNRGPAGAFVKDDAGRVFVAHRGKLTRGKAGLRKELVLSHFNTVVSARDGDTSERVILICDIYEPALIDKLFKFAADARLVADTVANMRSIPRTAGGPKDSPDTKETLPSENSEASTVVTGKLQKYFAEFSGKSKYQISASIGSRVVIHGDIVDALAKYRSEHGELQKNQAIDLAVVCKQHVELYEVKTSSDTTSIYTAVGQLLLHGESLSEELGVPVKRFMVLPTAPHPRFAKHIKNVLKANILTFSRKGKKYSFHDS